MKLWKKILIGFGAFLLLLGIAFYVIYGGWQHEGPGTVHPTPVPADMVAARAERQAGAAAGLPSDERASKQILFGDLHVHTTFSADAFAASVPLMGGEGAHPPADACDFARYCSSLDFFAITDHAESMTPRHWRETKESIRQCNAVAGDPENPDLVAYLGWEWSQVGQTPEDHYGHKNVIFRDLGEDQVPTRPLAAKGLAATAMKGQGIGWWTLLTVPIREFPRRQRYLDLAKFQREIVGVDECPAGVPVRDLPDDCREIAETPQVLFERLAEWGFDAIVIPHGTTWGFYTPPGTNWDKQISRAQHDPEKQDLIEVYSGHGNSEEYREWRAVSTAADGTQTCPAPTENYEPCCWRAGEIIRKRCGDVPADECERRVEKARADYVAARVVGHLAIPGATVEDWGNCGQCEDCFNPAFNFRPGNSVQYILARGNFDDPEQPLHMRFGFLASSDNHTARPGTGYKEFARRKNTEARGPRSEAWRDRIFGKPESPTPESRTIPEDIAERVPPFRLIHLERQASFFMTGGLVAVHAEGRDRNSIWKALKRREVYGTSGDRILLWFDLANAPGGAVPMGSDLPLTEAPRFVVRAVGSFKQKPGCPDWTTNELSADRMQHICAGECYYPSDERRLITRIEVVRIRPQVDDDEPLAPLIQDAWKTLPCPADPAGCRVEFEDPDFEAGGRDVVYYVRAIQEPTMAVNAGGVRCVDEDCTRVEPCYGDWRTPYDDDCLSENEERAWSSPIYVRFAKKAAEGTDTPGAAGAAPPAAAGAEVK